MIVAHGLIKHYGHTIAVQDLSFTVRPGLVTGFLGPNDAGKPVTELRHSFPGRKRIAMCGAARQEPRRPSVTSGWAAGASANVTGLCSWG